MAAEFLILYDKITAFDAPGYNDSEISTFLSKAQERKVLAYYNPKGNKYADGFEKTEKRRKDLDELVTDTGQLVPLPHSSSNYPNGVFVELPQNFLFTIAEDCSISTTTCLADSLPTESGISYKRVRIMPVPHDLYARNITNPFAKPSKSLVWRMDYSVDQTLSDTYYPKRHELIGDGTYTIVYYHARFIRRPREIVVNRTTPANQVNSELDPVMFRDIVDEAVKIATGVTTPELYQQKTIEGIKSE